MKNLYFLFIFNFFFTINNSFAGPGDTIAVQTFEYTGFPVGQGWLAPREGHFDFSAVDNLDFEKIIIEYNLKCDNTQSPACGEWDYLSYLKLINHTGIGKHPNFTVGGEGGYLPQEFSYVTEQAWNYESRLEEHVDYTPNDYTEYEIGEGVLSLLNILDGSQKDGRSYFIYTAEELNIAGMSDGNITGLKFNINSPGDDLHRLTIRIKQTTESELNSIPEDLDFTTVYDKSISFENTGWQAIDFTDFIDWDGSSNLLIDLSYASPMGNQGTDILATTLDWNSSLFAKQNDYYFNFNGPDAIELPVDNFSDLNNEVTVAFWCYGNGEQPQNDSAFEARNDDGNRILNAHLPWGNNKIYWDAGNGADGYDRIEKVVTNPSTAKGKWNHWAFTKSATTGSMKIYLNGQPWYNETGKNRNIGQIAKFIIGRGLWNADNFYDGRIDDFQVWKKKLNASTIQDWMTKDIDASHPYFDDLIAYYNFDDEGMTTMDAVSNLTATLKGLPQRLDYNGQRIKGFTSSMNRPNVKFLNHSNTPTFTSQYVVDSFPMGQIMVETYVQNNPNEKPELDETLFVYPSYYNNYVYDENGMATDSTLVDTEVTLDLEYIEYNTTTDGEEITESIELGRFITPYGNGLSLGNDGWTWIFDVSDFKQYLNGNDVHLEAGNFQELLNMKFLFIEGTPARDVLNIQNLYSVNPQLSEFDNIVVDTTIQLDPDAKMFKMKSTVSGHWFGQGANCGEFCDNVHTLEVNGEGVHAWQIIQECGENPLYPQGGTWFYDRAGWCPGMPVTEQNIELNEFIDEDDTELTLDYDITYDPYGNYVTEIFFVSYDEPNFQNDVSIEEVIAPSKFKENGRFNPTCSSPIIRIKNTGSNLLTSADIEYSIVGQSTQTYHWSGSLEFLEDAVVKLPTLDVNDFYAGGSEIFNVKISNPNASVDEYEHNNERYSNFELAPQYDQQLIIWFKTNNKAWENSYKVYDSENNIVYTKNNFQNNHLHKDTLNLPTGCYTFKAFDTAGDGMYNWPSNAGNGYIKLKLLNGNNLVELENWFGEHISHQYVNLADIDATINIAKTSFNIYPNPSSGMFYMDFSDNLTDFEIDIYDISGHQVLPKINIKNSLGVEELNLSTLEDGFYLINIKSDNFRTTKKVFISK